MHSTFKLFKIVFFSFLIIFTLIIGMGYTFTFYKENILSFITPASIKNISVDDVDIAYQEHGDSKNQTIILFHGTGANSFVWENLSLYLADHNYHVLALDIPPFGWSSIPQSQDYRKEVQAQRINQLLDKLAIKNPIILGHSYNSKIALELAVHRSIHSLILVAPVLDYKKAEPISFTTSFLARCSLIRDPLLSLFVNNPLLATNVLHSFMYKKDVDVTKTVSFLVLPFAKNGLNHAYGEWFQEFFSPRSQTNDWENIQNISNKKIIVLWGEKDTISPYENYEKLHALKSDTILIPLHDVGHMPHLENSDDFNKKTLQAISYTSSTIPTGQ